MAERWLSAGAARTLATPPGAFTALEAFALRSILAFAREPENEGLELMFCIDPAGEELVGVTTGRKAAPITDAMRAAMGAGGARFWHNHPSRDSLSHHDWLCAATGERVEPVAINASGSIFAGRIPAWRDEIRHAIDEAPSVAADVEFAMSDSCRASGETDLAVAIATFTGHVINLALAELGACAYAHLLSAPDQAVMQEAEATGVLRAGLDRATAEFRPLLQPRAGTALSSGRPGAG